MPSLASLPTLFGRASIVFGEHGALRETAGELRALGAELTAGAEPSAAPGDLVGRFCSELLAHFASEEAGAYFGTIVEDCPRLHHRIARLETEHAQMLSSVERLLVLAGDEARWRDLAERIPMLLARLEAHEHAEVLLLQEFLLRDDGAGE